MKNSFGTAVTLTLFGESHGEEIGAVLDGLAPGLTVDDDFISHQLSLRRPQGTISTPRRESDEFRIVSGVYNGKTTGTPLAILIPNANVQSGDYPVGMVRPGHADYTAQCKYHGYQDPRGGGHFSGRLTAALVAAGAIAISALQENDICIGTHIRELAGLEDRPFEDLVADVETLGDMIFPVLDERIAERMKEEILAASEEGDSVGGTLETVVTGVPAGLGDPWFDSVESVLSHAIFGIPAVKGIEFGEGFGFARLRGSEANDPLRIEGGKVRHLSNHSGGINGGITNGMPLLFRSVIRPTPTIHRPQASINLATMENETQLSGGRHDPAIVHRARVVVDSVTALVLCDLLAQRYGTDYLAQI